MFGDQFEKHKPAHYLPFRRRLDLKTVDQSSSRGTCCTVKDPAANRYWQLDPEEAFLLKSLDACTSARELRSGFERQFAPRRLTEQQLTAVLARFHAEGLLVTDRPGQSEAIFERLKQWRRLAPLRLAGQICAWRFRGIDADRWLARIAPRFAWLFTSFAAALLLLLLTTALSIVGLHWPALVRDFVAAKEAFTADQVLWVLATIAAADAGPASALDALEALVAG